MSTETTTRANETTAAAKPECLLSLQELARMLKNGEDVQVVDVRTPLEYSGNRLDCAINLPLDELDKHAASLDGRKRLILVCQSGNRARLASQTLARCGLTNAEILEGGMKAWIAGGLPHRKGRKVISVMRQVQMVVGLGVVAGVLLGTLVDPLWYALSGAMGLGLAIAGATGFCGLALVLAKMPWNRVPAGSAGATGGGASCATASCQA